MNKLNYFFEALSFSLAWFFIVWTFFWLTGIVFNYEEFFFMYGLIIGLTISCSYIISKIYELNFKNEEYYE